MLHGSCHCGAVRWQLAGMPASATACRCSVCRRYGLLLAYGCEGEDVEIAGDTRALRGDSVGFHFCPACGCVACWRALQPNAKGRRLIAVNLRLTEPGSIADVPIRHFDCLDT